MLIQKLTGWITPQRLQGNLNVVPSEVGGASLQAKTAWPSHSEQTIKPDDDYDGLALVVVKPVPRLPACVASVAWDTDNILNHVVNVWAEVSAEGGEYIQTHALYGSARLPLLPEDVLAQYPYAFIYKDKEESFYRVVFSTGIWWWDDSGDKGMNLVVSENYPVYKADLSSESWEFLENSTKTFINFAYYNVVYASLKWTNFNIPNGSATATSYYKKATEPGPTL